MPGDLERQLGQLSGQLSSLQPALEKIEQRQHQAEEKITRLQEQVWEQVRKLNGVVERLDTGRQQSSSRWWDVLQILAAGLLGAALTRWMVQ